MGTSGAYGGSGSGAWGDAHDLYEQAAGATGTPPSVEQVAAAMVAALRRSNRGQTGPASYSAGSTAPARGPSSGGYTRSSTGGGGAGSGGGMGRRAARGAAALGGAQAYRARDAGALTDLGLDLAALDALPNDRARCAAIADALLGAPAHPDDAAMKAATILTMMDALKDGSLGSDDLIERFTSNLTYELVLVELTSQRRASAVRPKDAAKTESKVKKYIQASLKADREKAGRTVGTQGLIDRAARLAARTLRIFGGKQ